MVYSTNHCKAHQLTLTQGCLYVTILSVLNSISLKNQDSGIKNDLSHASTVPCNPTQVKHISYKISYTFSLFASVSNSAILAHFCQKLGSSKEISVLFPEATKLACEGDKN